MGQAQYDPDYDGHRRWNAGRFVGAERPLTPNQVWKVRFHLERDQRTRDLALFDLAIDSKLHGCDVVATRIGDIVSGGKVKARPRLCRRRPARVARADRAGAHRPDQ